jgi:hypothetical protein
MTSKVAIQMSIHLIDDGDCECEVAEFSAKL